jgi:V-type H+-transporting ATPase subunit C
MSYQLISAPADPSKEKTAANCQDAVGDIAKVCKWPLPELKVGTLDSLMQLSDDLAKVDIQVESVVHKIERDLKDQLAVETALTINDMPPEQYTESFQWELGKFQIKSSLREMVDEIQKEVGKLDTTVKEQIGKYNAIKSGLSQIERKSTGNLMVKALDGLVKKDDIVETEGFSTVMVVVPRNAEKEWLAQYEQFAPAQVPGEKGTVTIYGAVPRSAHKYICEDGDLQLYGPVVIRKCLDDFKAECRKARFTVRDYTYSEEEMAAGKEEKAKLTNEKEKVYAQCVRQCITAYKVGYIDWMHIKAIRIFVESVLRYGLPPNFQVMCLLPKKGKADKLTKKLGDVYAKLGSGAAFGGGGGDGPQEEAFYPYVYLPLNATASAAEA